MDRNGRGNDPHIGFCKSLSARRAWIEIPLTSPLLGIVPSLSARRAWIEIVRCPIATHPILVALRKESVDRNWQDIDDRETISAVALRKESVDRNQDNISISYAPQEVALRKESVDRNGKKGSGKSTTLTSLSARRAWIEITPPRLCSSAPRRSPQGERG